jgi:hypothetical protein
MWKSFSFTFSLAMNLSKCEDSITAETHFSRYLVGVVGLAQRSPANGHSGRQSALLNRGFTVRPDRWDSQDEPAEQADGIRKVGSLVRPHSRLIFDMQGNNAGNVRENVVMMFWSRW